MPQISNVSAPEQAQIRTDIDGAVARLPNLITDPALRDCIRARAQGNASVIVGGDACDPHVLGYNEQRSVGPFTVWKSDDIHLCLRNHATLPNPDTEIENTLIHEWAHSCCWSHGDGKGVPS